MSNKVLFLTPFIKPGGGPPGYVHNLMMGYQEIFENKKANNTFYFHGEFSEDRNKATGEKRSEFSVKLLLIRLLTRIGLKPILSRKQRAARKKIDNVDLVVFQGYQEIYLAKYAKKLGKRIAYMPHSPSIMADEYKMLSELNALAFDERYYAKLQADESILFSISDFVVFPSKGASVNYISKFNEVLKDKKLIYIKSGVKVNANVMDFKVSRTGSVRVLFAGRYVSHKGYDLFCEAAQQVIDFHKDVEFLTVGDGPMKRNYDGIKNLGWRDDIYDILKSVDIVVIPNRISYYDLLPLECAALGKPLVMTSVGGSIDQMEDLRDSVACAGQNPQDLAKSIVIGIIKFKSDPTWGINNKSAFNSIFSANRFAERWDAAIDDMVGIN